MAAAVANREAAEITRVASAKWALDHYLKEHTLLVWLFLQINVRADINFSSCHYYNFY